MIPKAIAAILLMSQLANSRRTDSAAPASMRSPRTRTSKRMIYYYFGGKEGLYIAVLEEAYRKIRNIEVLLDLAHEPPVQAPPWSAPHSTIKTLTRNSSGW
jgi:AcrR family transcriptional regulator